MPIFLHKKGTYFNPHPRKGSDVPASGQRSRQSDFNPHPRKGSDLGTIKDLEALREISIHTPARGVTRSLR